jgi:methylmalonyl-CoA/ethylmalonyl-CoA epimerase
MLKLHHIGIAVKDIGEATARYVHVLGYEIKSEFIHDPVQTAYVQFLKRADDPVYLELVSPDGNKSKLNGAIQQGGGLNHLCYVTSEIEMAYRQLRNDGMFLLQPPVPAVAFQGRRIAWLMAADRVPVELVEAGPPNEL